MSCKHIDYVCSSNGIFCHDCGTFFPEESAAYRSTA